MFGPRKARRQAAALQERRCCGFCFAYSPDYGILSQRMHDLEYFRQHLQLFETMARNRGVTLDLQAFQALDHERRALITDVEHRKAERNKASEEIAGLKKSGQDAAARIAEMKQLSNSIREDDQRI